VGLKQKRKVIISRNAQRSLKVIYDHIRKKEPKHIAHRVKKEIIECCKDLQYFSGYSKELLLDELNQDYRSVAKWDYLIIYRVTEKQVRILKIIHTSIHPDRRKEL